MDAMRTVRQMMTGKDNLTVDLFRVLAAMSVLVGLLLACIAVLWPKHPFDIQAFGAGVGMLLGAGLAIRAKASTEPDSSPGTTASSTSTTSTTIVEKTAA